MPRDDSIAAPLPLLTRETIDARVAERVRWREAEMTARAKVEELDRWFAGLRVVLGEEAWRAYVPSDFFQLMQPLNNPHSRLPPLSRSHRACLSLKAIQRSPHEFGPFCVDSDEAARVFRA